MRLRVQIGILMMALFALSCKSSKDVEGDGHLPNIRTDQLLENLKAEELKCDWMSVKYEVEIKSEKLEDSFKMYVRLRRDSAIWISATYYAVEVARFLFTPDSVKYIDRRNNKFYVGDYSYITDEFMVDANYNILQSLIMANSLEAIDSGDEKIRSSKDGDSYFVGFLRPGQLRRALKNEDQSKEMDVAVSMWVNPENFRIDKTSLFDFNEDRTLTASYSDYEKTCNSSYPYSTLYEADSPNEHAEVKTSVMKLTPDKKVSLSFTIPEKYEQITP